MNELYHYGVLGMHWGIRRYQNEDGSLTAAGKKHYGVSSETKEKAKKVAKGTAIVVGAAGATAGTIAGAKYVKKKNTKTYPSDEEMQKKIKEDNLRKAYDRTREENNKFGQVKNVTDSVKNIASSTKDAYDKEKKKSSQITTLDVTNMTTKELQDAVNRMNLEDNYVRLVNNRTAIDVGGDNVDKILDVIGTVAGTAGSVVGLGLAISKIIGK